MSKKGVYRFTGVNKFLTQGPLRKLFQPLFYDRSDYIHQNFINPLYDCLLNIEDKVPKDKRLLFSFWLVQVPQEFFEGVFLDAREPNSLWFATKQADNLNSERCFYITQAYILWMLEQLLKNDRSFQKEINLTIEQTEHIVKDVLKLKETINYLEFFRNEFNVGKLQKNKKNFIDPRDWIFEYIIQIFKIIFSDQELMNQTLKDWDNDILRKMSLIIYNTTFFSDIKRIAVD